MATIRKTITLTDSQDNWVKAQIANGGYTNDSEYFRDLIRREQEKTLLLRTAIEEGIASGVSSRQVEDIWADVEARHSEKNG